MSSFSKPQETDWFNPNQHSDVLLAEKQDEVLKYMSLKGLSWMGELSREVGLNADEINKILYNCKRLGYLDRVYPDPNFPQAPFRGRMAELWARGIIGYQSFTAYAWWTLTKAGIEYLKVKFRHSALPIRSSLVNYHGLIVVPLSDEVKPEEIDKLFKAILSEDEK